MQTFKDFKKEVTKIGDVVMIHEIEILTIQQNGKKPITKEVTKTVEYRGEDAIRRIPEDVRKQLDDLMSGKLHVRPTTADFTDKKFGKNFLQEQNKFRKMHGLKSLKLSKELVKACSARAKDLALKDDASPRKNSREVLVVILSTNADFHIRAPDIVSRWYAEGAGYKYDAEPTNSKAEHFTQMIWKASKEFGIALAKSNTNKTFVVALYHPIGNIPGEYLKNVPPIGSKP